MNKWVITAAVLLGALMSAIDTSVVNVALVHIQSTYGGTTQQVSWVSTAYLITLAIIMPLTAWLSSVMGRKRMYLLAVFVFTAASMLCGLSRTLGQLIAFRILQGFGGGVLQPTAQAIMRETFPAQQLGGTLGTAIVITLLDHRTTIASANLVRYASLQNPTFVHWWQTYQQLLVAHGTDPWTARLQALSVLQRFISQQASVVAFDYAFAAIASVFLICLPLVLLIRRRRVPAEASVAME